MVKLLENTDQIASCSTETPPANGNCNGKDASKATSFLNGNSVSVNGVSKVNGYAAKKATKVNGDSCKKLSNGNSDVQTDSGNSDDEVLSKESSANGQFHNEDREIPLNGSNTPSESSSSSSPENGKEEQSHQLLNGFANFEDEHIHVLVVNDLCNAFSDGLASNDDLGELSRQLHDTDANTLNGSNASSKADLKTCSTSQNGESSSNEDSSDKNQKMVVNGNKKKNNKFKKKSKHNLSPVANGKSTNKNVNSGEKESLPQKNPTALRNPGVTYSDALKNGTNKISKSSNGNTSGESSETACPVQQLPSDSTKSATIKSDKLASNKSDKIKPKSAEVSACTDKISSQNPPQESANSTNNRPRDTESPMPSTKNISPGKSYSSALRNGANGNSQPNHQITSDCKKSENTLGNGELLGTCSSVEQLSITNGETSRTQSSVEQLSTANSASTTIHLPIEQLNACVTNSAIDNTLALAYHPSDTLAPGMLEAATDNDDAEWSTMAINGSVMDPNDEYADAAYPESVIDERPATETVNPERIVFGNIVFEHGIPEFVPRQNYIEEQPEMLNTEPVVFGNIIEEQQSIESLNSEPVAFENNIEEQQSIESLNSEPVAFENNIEEQPETLNTEPIIFGDIVFEHGIPEFVPGQTYTSYDSGRGDSELLYDASMPYCCEFPKEKTSQLIGKKGTFKFEIERKSGVNFWVYPADTETNIICMTGTGAQIEKAKTLIKHRFRNVPLTQWYGPNPAGLTLSEHYYARLPELTDFCGVVSCFNSPHCFWIQQYAHPQFHQLETLELAMSAHFNTIVDAPGIDNPTIGSVVSVPACRIGDNIRWIRGQIVNLIPEENAAAVRYLDHGGDHTVPIDQLRPVRQEFFSIPFFASLCCLFDIFPTGSEWSEEALAEFTRLCTCPKFVPLVSVVGKSPECYFVSITACDPETNHRVDVASHLVKKGLAVRPASSLYYGPKNH